MTQWPQQGRCGACGRAATGFPSGRWEHTGVPCRARSQSMWRVDDALIRQAVRFVPDGEPLPPEPDKSHWHETAHDENGIPTQLGWCQGQCVHSAREYLAAEAAEREAAERDRVGGAS